MFDAESVGCEEKGEHADCRAILKVTQDGSPSIVTAGFSSIRPIFRPTVVLTASRNVKTVKAVRSARYIVFELGFLPLRNEIDKSAYGSLKLVLEFNSSFSTKQPAKHVDDFFDSANCERI